MMEQTPKDLLKSLTLSSQYPDIFINTVDGARIIIAGFPIKERKIISEFVFSAIGEKYKRDFGERKRWIGRVTGYKLEHKVCPKCKYMNTEQDEIWDYCPSCGTRLDPPEG
jgi:hypothetical protein